jgi:hypothetical protein
LLQKARFKDIEVNLSNQTTTFPDRESFANYVKTVIMKPFLGHIHDAKKKNQFVDAFLNEFERSSRWKWLLDFMLLGIFARK